MTQIVDDLVSFKVPGVAILNPTKAGEVGIKVAIAVKPKRAEAKTQNLMTEAQFKEAVEKCTGCNECAFVCPPHTTISELMAEAKKGNLEPFSSLYETCVGCNRCQQVCPQNIPIMDLYEYANRQYVKNQKFKMRAGRGPARDTEIRSVGAPRVHQHDIRSHCPSRMLQLPQGHQRVLQHGQGVCGPRLHRRDLAGAWPWICHSTRMLTERPSGSSIRRRLRWTQHLQHRLVRGQRQHRGRCYQGGHHLRSPEPQGQLRRYRRLHLEQSRSLR